MSGFLRGIAVIAAMLFGCGAAFAEDINSANHMMAGCRSLVARTSSDVFDQGKCVGIINTLVDTGRTCAPKGSTTGQSVRIVVKYIDDRPERMHENFTALALEALRAAWPCKN
jgi:hypothetical protein